MSSNMERVAAMPDASLYVNRDGRRADDCVDSHGGGNLIKIPRSGGGTQNTSPKQSYVEIRENGHVLGLEKSFFLSPLHHDV